MVLGGSWGYWGEIWGILECYGVLQGTAGYWGALVGTSGTGGTDG